MELQRVQGLFESILEQVGRVVVGQQELVEGVVLALFAEGSVLIEGPPGLGKTLLVNVLSKTVSCQFRRVQFTPDLMPSDLTGHSIYDMRKQEFSFNPGPVFTNLLLTDEINRSPPKTQSGAAGGDAGAAGQCGRNDAYVAASVSGDCDSESD